MIAAAQDELLKVDEENNRAGDQDAAKSKQGGSVDAGKKEASDRGKDNEDQAASTDIVGKISNMKKFDSRTATKVPPPPSNNVANNKLSSTMTSEKLRIPPTSAFMASQSKLYHILQEASHQRSQANRAVH